jgi:hypothetical protein
VNQINLFVATAVSATMTTKSDYESLDESDVADAISRGIFQKLKETNHLKVVK